MTVEHLPPMLGFPQEEICEPSYCVAFYTCLIGPFRVFVYVPGGVVAEGWCIERKTNNPYLKTADQFFGDYSYNGVTRSMPNPDPVALLAIIHDLTKEGPDENSMPSTGADDSVSALHLTEERSIGFAKWKRD